MKRVVSLSLGSSRRDKTVTVPLLGETFEIARIGMDGNQDAYARRLAELDGTVDAIGFGGMDQYVWSDGKRYEFTAARKLLAGAKKTPVLDGSGLKNSLEREAVHWLSREKIADFAKQKTLIVCGVDRFGMSEAVASYGGPLVFGDLMFALGIPFPIPGWKQHRTIAQMLLPVLIHLPLSVLYPMGEKQNSITPKWQRWYEWADVIAGDFLYIRRYMPPPESDALRGKIILTNTTTEEDTRELARRGARLLVTTTPRFEGRTFGTNVMEAVLVAHNGGKLLEPEGYLQVLRELDWKPTVEALQPEEAVAAR